MQASNTPSPQTVADEGREEVPRSKRSSVDRCVRTAACCVSGHRWVTARHYTRTQATVAWAYLGFMTMVL